MGATSTSDDKGWLAQLVVRSKRLVGLDASRHVDKRAAERLYAAAVAQARKPVFYTQVGVPDTPDARLELVQLHVILLLRRLQRDEVNGHGLGQALFDTFFVDLDRSLREGGVGDLSVGKWIKKLGQQFYARVATLELALADGEHTVLAREIRDAVMGDDAPTVQVDALADYLLAADRELAARAADGTALAALRFDGIDPIQPGSETNPTQQTPPA